jgi:predicted nucleotidyltransferase component of viral defense system
MKTYRETYIRRAEIAQLILLHQLYMQRESQNLIFQGGTAIRWCYGGSRFSEDLDFVTPLDSQAVKKILMGAIRGVEKVMIPHFGIGTATVAEKASRTEALKCFVDFRPENARENISIKLEFEGLAAKRLPEKTNHVLSSLPSVAYMIAAGEFRVPRPHTVVVAETPEEILSDKVRSLLERPYLKGRDLYDVRHLCSVLKVAVDTEITKRKFVLYQTPFVARRDMDFFALPSEDGRKAMRDAMDKDLSRFLPPDVLEIYRKEGYAVFLETVRLLFMELKEKGVLLP